MERGLARRGDPIDGEPISAAIDEAEQGVREGGIPIGSVLVHKGEILGRGHNRRVQKGSCILHAEMDALENAGRLSASVYKECVLYTTLSPCAMCSGAIILYGIPKVVIGENKSFMGEESLLRSRGVDIQVVQDVACMQLMERFIKHLSIQMMLVKISSLLMMTVRISLSRQKCHRFWQQEIIFW